MREVGRVRPSHELKNEKEKDQKMPSQKAMSISDLNMFLQGGSLPVAAMGKSRRFRYSNITAKKDGVCLLFQGIIAQRVNRIKKQFDGLGYALEIVDIESDGLDFRHRLSVAVDGFEAPKIDTSKEPGVVPEYVSIKNANWHAAMAVKIRNVGSNKENRKHAREFIRRENSKTFIYEKESGQLQFVGELEAGIAFIQKKMETDGWTDVNWVIYLPDAIYQQIER